MGWGERLFGSGFAQRSSSPQAPSASGLLERLLGSGFRYKSPREPLAPPEQATVPATRMVAGRAAVGGQVKLSSDALVFEPVDTDAARRILVGAGRAGLLPGVGVANRVLDQTKLLEPMTIPLASIKSVSREQPSGLIPRLSTPPSVRLGLEDGTSVNLGVLNSPLSPNIARKNTKARDSFAEQLTTLRSAS